MPISLEERIIEERNRMRVSIETLRKRVDEHAPGPQSNRILHKTLQYESLGHLDFSLFPCPPVIDHGQGARLWDVDGNEYIDLHAGFTVDVLGHANLEVNNAIKAQMDKYNQFAELPNEARAELARLLCERHPGDFEKKVFWAVTGGEAVEICMKLSRWYTGKSFLITHWGDYHGRTAGAMALTSSKAGLIPYNYPVPPLDTAVIRIPFPYCYRCPWDKSYPACDLFCARQFEQSFERSGSVFNNPATNVCNVAAILIETFQSSVGYVIPPLPYLAYLKQIADKYDFVFAVDEVQNGMGRTGKQWAIEHAGVVPDLLVMAKSLSNGLPLSAVTGRAEMMDSWGPGAHCSTFTAYPPACAGGVKVFEIFEREHIIEDTVEKGNYLRAGLEDLASHHPSIGIFDSLGLYTGLELVLNRSTKQPASKATAWAHAELVKNGIICIYSGYFANRLAFAPPLVITKEELWRALSILDRVLTKMEKEFDIT
jgi:4-aminobutyrate aminotransferase-like enzyme